MPAKDADGEGRVWVGKHVGLVKVWGFKGAEVCFEPFIKGRK